MSKREVLTSQQKIILDYLKNTKTHPTAKAIYKVVKEKLPRISLSTVYRILDKLKEKGEIQEISGKIRRFDGYTLPHAHFICLKCGQVFDIDNDFKYLENQKLDVGDVVNYQLYFYGYCNKCKSKIKNNKILKGRTIKN